MQAGTLLKSKIVWVVAVAVVVVAIVVIIVSGGNDESRLVGVWEFEEVLSHRSFGLFGWETNEYLATLEFFSNGIVILAFEPLGENSVSHFRDQGTWHAENGRIVFIDGMSLGTTSHTLVFGGAWDYRITGSTLTLEDHRGVVRTFTQRTTTETRRAAAEPQRETAEAQRAATETRDVTPEPQRVTTSSPLIGTWEAEDGTYVHLFDNGRGKAESDGDITEFRWEAMSTRDVFLYRAHHDSEVIDEILSEANDNAAAVVRGAMRIEDAVAFIAENRETLRSSNLYGRIHSMAQFLDINKDDFDVFLISVAHFGRDDSEMPPLVLFYNFEGHNTIEVSRTDLGMSFSGQTDIRRRLSWETLTRID